MTAQQRDALRKIRRDLQKMHLAYNDGKNPAKVVADMIDVFLPGLDGEEDE